MKVYNHNGEWIQQDRSIRADHRAFCYGDGFFESIRVMDGRALFVENHHKRVLDTSKALKIEVPESFTIDSMRSQCQALISQNHITAGGRIRMTVSRKAGGLYLPESNEMDVFFQATKFESNRFALNPNGKDVDIYQDIKKDINSLSIYKTLNCNVYVMASLYAQEKDWDEALIQNERSSIIEAVSSNLFLVSNGVLYTPGLEDGCVGGTMRMNVINLAIQHGIKVYECSLSPQNLLVADEIFLTNAIRGIVWVSSYRTKRYFNTTARMLVDLLNEKALADISAQV